MPGNRSPFAGRSIEGDRNVLDRLRAGQLHDLVSLPVSQLLRLIAIFAVLIIHGTYDAQVAFMHPPEAGWVDVLGVILNQLARFSVPVFVFLSGYGLAYKFRDTQALLPGAKDFYSNRMTRIGIPFL